MAYKDTERNGLHRDGKKAHPWWATDEEWQALKDVAEAQGCSNVTSLLREIATGQIKLKRK